jgi:hypothetical protein
VPDAKPSVFDNQIDEALAPYFATVHVEMISIVQAFALYNLIQQNVIQVPAWDGWDWAYFLRGLTVFFLAIAIWHAYVTQLAYVATLHWSHTLFPFSFGVLQFMLGNQRVLKPSIDEPNLYYFILLMSLTAITGAAAYFNTLLQHRSNRTKMRFALNFGENAQRLHVFWWKVHIALALFMLVTFLLFLPLAAIAKWKYRTFEEIAFPLFTTIVAALAIYIDARFCAKHRWTPGAVRAIYENLYGKTLNWDEHGVLCEKKTN